MNCPIHCVKRWVLYVLFVFVNFLPANNVFGADGQQAKRVLLISTESRFSVAFPGIAQNALDRLRELHTGPLEVYAESLNLIRFSSESYQRVLQDYLRDKYASEPPDLIVLIYVGTLRVGGRFLENIFPMSPVVAVGLTEEDLSSAPLGARTTGVAHRSDPGGTMELVLRLQPDIRRVVLIGGTAPVDRDLMNRTRQAVRPFSGRIEFVVWNDRSIGDILKAVTSLPKQTAILFTRMFQDGASRAIVSASAARSIAKASNAPVYVMADEMLGTGAVGGAAVNTESLGKRAGELAYQVLEGADPKSLPVQVLDEGVPIFDWRALKRWGIEERRLPPGSEIHFRPVAIWERYWWLFIVVLALSVIEGALIYILLREKRSRKLAQQALEERLRFEQLVRELSNTFINLPAEKVEDQLIEALQRVANLLKFDIAALSVFTGPGHRGRVAYLWWSEDVPEISSKLTDKDFPWVARELSEGRDVSLRSLDELPPQAHIDRATYEQNHVRSTYNVPMVAGGRVLGVLGLCTVFEEREMSPELLQSQRLLGEVFANALARKNAEEARLESENRFRIVADSAPVMIWMSAANKLCEYFNKQWLDFTGRTLEQEVGDGWTDGVHPEDRRGCLDVYSKSFEAQQEFTMEYRLRRWDGEYRWILDHGVPRFDANGTFLGYIGSCIDISDRKQTEEIVRVAVEASPNAILMVDGLGQILLVNARGEKLFGYARDELIGHSMAIVVPQWVHKSPPAHGSDLGNEPEAGPMGTGGETFGLRKDGSEVPIEIGLSPIRTIEGWITLAMIIDISERRHAQDELEKERRFLRQVIDTVPNFIFAKDREGRFTLANRAVAEAYGTSVEDLIGKTDAEFNPNRKEVEFFRRMDLEVMERLQDRFIPEERITDAQGNVRWVQTVKRPIIGSNGTAQQVLGASTDITQRKKIEIDLQEHRAELAHVARIATIGELAASLAHELNQPLTAILSNAQAALRFMTSKTIDLGEVREILQDIVNDNSRAGEVIRRMRAMVKKENLEFASLDLASVIGDVTALVHSDAILENVRISLQLDDDLPPVRGDRVQLQQVVLNLLLNAFDAMKERPADQREAKVQVQWQGAHFIQVAVSDSGTGLRGNALEKIFQPFYTTKRDGLGLGLSICRSIIDAHGGRLWAEKNHGPGATFYFTLPIEENGEGRVSSVTK